MGNEEREKTGSILEKVAVNRRAFLAWLIVTVSTAACGKEIIPTPLATPTIPPSPTKEIPTPTPTLEVRPTPTPYKIETQMGGFGGELTLEEQAAVAAVGKR
ncbi:MAG: hypothetical protein ACOZBZ_04990, partial [Patescibacteria group bacterium]